jgi:hypothetical protein
MRNREMPKCEIATWSFGDRDLESRDASQQEFATCEIPKCRNAKTPFGVGCGHRLRPHVKGKVKGAKGIRLKRFTV